MGARPPAQGPRLRGPPQISICHSPWGLDQLFLQQGFTHTPMPGVGLMSSQFWWSDHLAFREASLAEETGICSCAAVVKSSTVEEHKRGSPSSGVLAQGLEKVSGRRWELGLNDEMEPES